MSRHPWSHRAQSQATSVPWLGPASEAQCATFRPPSPNLTYQRVGRLPRLCATRSTREAPVRASTVST